MPACFPMAAENATRRASELHVVELRLCVLAGLKKQLEPSLSPSSFIELRPEVWVVTRVQRPECIHTFASGSVSSIHLSISSKSAKTSTMVDSLSSAEDGSSPS